MTQGIHSQNVAEHLYRYAAFLRSEHERAKALDFFDDEKASRLEIEVIEVELLAGQLHDLKEWIVKPAVERRDLQPLEASAKSASQNNRFEHQNDYVQRHGSFNTLGFGVIPNFRADPLSLEHFDNIANDPNKASRY